MFYELKEICHNLSNVAIDKECKDKIAGFIDIIVRLSEFVRKEGLSAAEEISYSLDETDTCQDFLKSLIEMLTDGFCDSLICEIGMHEYLSDMSNAVDSLIHLISIRGVLMLQQNMNPMVVEKAMLAMIPMDIKNDIQALLKDKKKVREEEQDRKNHCILKQLVADDDRGIDENDHSMLNQISVVIMHLDDRSIQRLLREVNYYDIGLVMHEMTSKTRKKIFQNMGDKVAGLVAFDIVHFTDDDLSVDNISDACVKILRAYMELCDTDQVYAYDEKDVKKVLESYGEGG